MCRLHRSVHSQASLSISVALVTSSNEYSPVKAQSDDDDIPTPVESIVFIISFELHVHSTHKHQLLFFLSGGLTSFREEGLCFATKSWYSCLCNLCIDLHRTRDDKRYRVIVLLLCLLLLLFLVCCSVYRAIPSVSCDLPSTPDVCSCARSVVSVRNFKGFH